MKLQNPPSFQNVNQVLYQIITDAKQDKHQRLGQYFYNTYLGRPQNRPDADRELRPGEVHTLPNPELFYEKDHGKASEMIRNWLVHNCYCFSLPPRAR